MTVGNGPVAVVTGTSRGIGAGIARRLMDDGYTVVGVSRSGSPEVARPTFHDLQLDLATEAEAVIERALAITGRIDALVNNAGQHSSAPCWELAPATFESLLQVNLTAPFLLSQQVLRHWVSAGNSGCIVNLCSVESEVGWADPPQAGYAATKGGMVGLTRALAYDFGSYGIRVNGVAPGAIETEMSPADRGPLTARIPLQRLGTVAEVADATAYLLSDRSSYITGEILFADGGYRLP